MAKVVLKRSRKNNLVSKVIMVGEAYLITIVQSADAALLWWC